MNLAVSGASGHLGRQVTALLFDQVSPVDVVLLTRSPEGLADAAARGADVRPADFNDPDGLAEALAGVERLLLISTDAVGQSVAQHRAAIDAAVAAGVKHVIYTSMYRPEKGNPAGAADAHRETEEALRASPLAWTFLRNNLYAENQIATVAQAVASGRLVTNAGDGAVAYVTRKDCAAAAAAVLTGEGHAGQAYDITGPTALSAADLAALGTTITGAPVEVVQVDDDALIAGLVAAGLPEPVAPWIASFGAAAREGWLDQPSSAVQDLTGRAPVSLRDVLEAHRAELPA
ncbi:NAD(P)H-binding protein [Streptomyces turgidiscabies]|uniref:NmrA family protein n=1 Tax=Streptomyces turgidiscabies (strain Car8) TaxID=698760 RepID=L7EX08_STRT8|nr:MULTISPECIES: NAD(P)H-binding protein [Streptomyces]ELP63226.1 NmrA family protein [Streptomyces turgidiscabies Car8]MDX3493194.1 NAD(P)H-binding protein [Streptomyces turgidiscabies]GAQ70491.1 quinone oxidoreductase 2 [Streptomyces turgidiscabies]